MSGVEDIDPSFIIICTLYASLPVIIKKEKDSTFATILLDFIQFDFTQIMFFKIL